MRWMQRVGGHRHAVVAVPNGGSLARLFLISVKFFSLRRGRMLAPSGLDDDRVQLQGLDFFNRRLGFLLAGKGTHPNAGQRAFGRLEFFGC